MKRSSKTGTIGNRRISSKRRNKMIKEEIEEHNRMNSLIDAFKNPYIRINGEKENYYFCPLCHHCYNKYYFNNGGHLKYQHGLEKEEIIKQWRCFLIRYPQKWYEYAKKKTEDLPIIRKETNKQLNSNSKAIVNIVDIPGEYRVYSDRMCICF